jgi:general secretion pathway protein K
MRQRGFALLAVILGVAVLSAIAMSLATATRVDLLSAAVLTRTAKAEMAADAGIAIALARLVSAKTGQEFTCNFDGTAIRAGIADEGGKVDLNAAPRGLLAVLFRGFGDSDEQAQQRAEAVADFIDPDDDAATGGSETEIYDKAGRPRPKNAPFETIDELDQVTGFEVASLSEESMLERLRPFITVYSRQPGVDLSLASPKLVSALSNLPPEYRATSDRRVFTLSAEAFTPEGGSFVRQSVIEMNPLVPGGYMLLGSWPRRSTSEPPPSERTAPC